MLNLNENNNNNENFIYNFFRTITIIKLEYIISSIIAVFTLTYYTMNKDEWVNQENIEYREAVEKRFKE